MEPDDDFGPHETCLTQQYDRPIMVHRYPTAVKAFYMKEDPENPARVLGMDMLAPEGYGDHRLGPARGLGGGPPSQDRRARTQPGALQWYLDLRRYGSVPHGGFGLGLERLVCWICVNSTHP